MTASAFSPTPCAPVVPSVAAICRLRPLGLRNAAITDGLWAERRRINRAVTLWHGLAQLETAGNLHNFRLAAGLGKGRYLGGSDDSGRPFPFLDSDVYKWLEAVGWELAQGWDAPLADAAAKVIELVAQAQRRDGYLNTFFQVARPGEEFRDLQWGHELYTLGHLIQAAVAWWRGVGDDRLLKIAQRAVARVEVEMGPGRRELIDGHPGIEMALVELYRATAEAQYLELASTFIDRRGRGLLGEGRFGSPYWQDHQPVRDAPCPAGHAVRQIYLDCGAVDVAVETDDRSLLQAVVRRWEEMVATRTYLTGGIGSRHRDEAFGDPYELPPDRAYAETCAAVGSVMLAWRLLLATGESRFADLIERTSLNGVLCALSIDGRGFFYTNPLQRRSSPCQAESGVARGQRAAWFPCACCPPNLMRFLATVPNLLATADAVGVQIHQYACGEVEASIDGGQVKLTIDTEYPWSGDVDVYVAEAPGSSWALSLRVPNWCRSGSLNILGDERALEVQRGIVTIERGWQAGDRVRLSLDMPTRVIVPDPRIDAIRGTVAYERGPLVYAVEQADLPRGVELEAIEVDPSSVPEPEGVSSLPGLTVLVGPALVRLGLAAQAWPYRDTSVPSRASVRRPCRVRAVPYFAWANRGPGGMRVWLPVVSER